MFFVSDKQTASLPDFTYFVFYLRLSKAVSVLWNMPDSQEFVSHLGARHSKVFCLTLGDTWFTFISYP